MSRIEIDMKRENFLLFLSAAIAVFGWFVFRRFSNPDMTETRLLITFWYEWLVGFAILIFVYVTTMRIK
jgi:hypothetical protein